jgi:acetolactate synthase-1/2/3 large subunit
LTNPDFERFAESFGIDGYRPQTWAEVEATLETVVRANEMSLVEITLG